LKTYIIPCILIFVSCLVFAFITAPYNLGVSHDSLYYLEVAENFSEGKGIIDDNGRFVNHWPPVYAILLGIIDFLTGLDVNDFGIGLNIFLIVLFAFSFYLILKELELSNTLNNVMLAILIAGLPLTVYRFFWSEGLFFVFLTLVLLFFIKWTNRKANKFIFSAGIISGLFFLTRYAGVGFIGGFSLFILFQKDAWIKRIRHLLIYLLPIVVIFLLWYFYSSTFDRPSINRKIIFNLIEFAKIKTGFFSIVSWFIHNTYTLLSIPIILIIAFFYFTQIKANYALFKQYLIKHRSILSLVMVLVLVYISFLFFSISLFDSSTPLNTRILAPVYPLILILIGVILNFFYSKINYKEVTYLLLFVLLFNSVASSFGVWKHHYTNGNGYNDKGHRNSEILKFVSKNEDLIFYSNEVALLRYYFDSKTKYLPRTHFNAQKKMNEQFAKQMQRMKSQVTKGEAEIVRFNLPNNFKYVSKEELKNEFSDFDIQEFKDGIIVKRKQN